MNCLEKNSADVFVQILSIFFVALRSQETCALISLQCGMYLCNCEIQYLHKRNIYPFSLSSCWKTCLLDSKCKGTLKKQGFLCLLDWKLLSKRRVFYTSVACVCGIGVVSYRVCMHVILRENIVAWLIRRERKFVWRSNHNQWIRNKLHPNANRQNMTHLKAEA